MDEIHTGSLRQLDNTVKKKTTQSHAHTHLNMVHYYSQFHIIRGSNQVLVYVRGYPKNSMHYQIDLTMYHH